MVKLFVRLDLARRNVLSASKIVQQKIKPPSIIDRCFVRVKFYS